MQSNPSNDIIKPREMNGSLCLFRFIGIGGKYE